MSGAIAGSPPCASGAEKPAGDDGAGAGAGIAYGPAGPRGGAAIGIGIAYGSAGATGGAAIGIGIGIGIAGGGEHASGIVGDDRGRTPIEGWMDIARGGGGAGIAVTGGEDAGRAIIDAGTGSCAGVSVGATRDGARSAAATGSGAGLARPTGAAAEGGATEGVERGGEGATDAMDERGATDGLGFGAAEGGRLAVAGPSPPDDSTSLRRVVAGAMLTGGALAGGPISGGRALVSAARASPISGGSAWAVAASSCALAASGGTKARGVFAEGATPDIALRMFERGAPPGRGTRGAPSVLGFRPSAPKTAPIRKLKSSTNRARARGAAHPSR